MIPDFEEKEVWPENEEQPYRVLPKGCYDASINEFISRFVEAFPDSRKRPELISKFLKLHIATCNHNLSLTQWLCGSYVTNKMEPGDIDVFTWLHHGQVDNLTASGKNFVKSVLNGKEASKHEFATHAFSFNYYPPGHPRRAVFEEMRKAWQKWFGHTRPLIDPNNVNGDRLPEAPKGIISITVGDPDSAPPVND